MSPSIRCIFDAKALMIARMSSRKTLIHYLSMTSSSFSCTTFTFQNGKEREGRRGHTCETSSVWLEGIRLVIRSVPVF